MTRVTGGGFIEVLFPSLPSNKFNYPHNHLDAAFYIHHNDYTPLNPGTNSNQPTIDLIDGWINIHWAMRYLGGT